MPDISGLGPYWVGTGTAALGAAGGLSKEMTNVHGCQSGNSLQATAFFCRNNRANSWAGDCAAI